MSLEGEFHEAMADGYSVKCKDVLERTPLLVAVQHSHWNVVRRILKKDRQGMTQDPDGRTACDLPNSPIRTKLL